jgi:hypothetical protein
MYVFIYLFTAEYRQQCRYYNDWTVSVVAGFFTTVYTSMLQFFATCACFQGRVFFQETCLGTRIFALADFFGGGTLFFFVSKCRRHCLSEDPLTNFAYVSMNSAQ